MDRRPQNHMLVFRVGSPSVFSAMLGWLVGFFWSSAIPTYRYFIFPCIIQSAYKLVAHSCHFYSFSIDFPTECLLLKCISPSYQHSKISCVVLSASNVVVLSSFLSTHNPFCRFFSMYAFSRTQCIGQLPRLRNQCSIRERHRKNSQ